MSLYSRHWFCALSGSVRGRVSEFRDAHKARYDCLSLCADLNKKNCVRCNRQARRAQSRRACSFNVWQPSGWIIRAVLAGTGYEITEAEDGEHALAAVAKQRPDLILMEIQLPSMDGYDVFGVGEDPVRLGLVASLARPGGNATGVNFFGQEVVPKALRLLHDLVPKAVRLAVLANPANRSVSDATIRAINETAPALGVTVQILHATTIGEIDAAFATFASERPDALFVVPDGFFSSRSGQFATLTARDKVPAAYWNRDFVAAGGLMSYGTDLADTYRQVGVYTGRILKGAKPADLAVVQSTKFLFAINHQTARALGIDVRPDVLSIADEVIE